MESLRRNTVKVQFLKAEPKPTDREMMQFVINNALTAKDIHTLYQDLYDCCIYIKFNEEQKYQQFISETNMLTFTYESGKTTEVTVKGASGIIRYVRMFNLPPEIDDKSISEAMHRFGKVLSIRREKFGAMSLLPVFSGVRGIYMEVEKEIPQFIYLQNIKTRIFYDGMKERCYKCGEENHKKPDCPQNSTENNKIQQAQIQQTIPLQPQVSVQSNEIIENNVKQSTHRETVVDTNEISTIHTPGISERVKYSDIAKITELQREAENKMENIRKMINLKEHLKERKQETDSSCIDTESEETAVQTKQRGRPSKKGRYNINKAKIPVMEMNNISTMFTQNMNTDNYMAPPPVPQNKINKNEETS